MKEQHSETQNKSKKSALIITIGCILAVCSVITFFTFIGEILSPKKVADGEITSLYEADYVLADKDSHKTIDDPCIVKYSYSANGKKIDSEQQFQSKTACADFPLKEGQKIQVQYKLNNIEESNIQTNGKASESSPWSALLISFLLVLGAIIALKPKSQPKV